MPSILVHEYVTGGGWTEPELPPGLAVEGLAMLRAVLADFQAWGRAEIITTLDRRLADVSLPAQGVIHLDPRDYERMLANLARQCDAALMIAPETKGTLARLSTLMEQKGARLLGCTPAGIAIAGNKWDCYRRFTQAGLPTPETWLVDVRHIMESAQDIGFPLVIKPLDGVGCDGVNLVPDPPSLQKVLGRIRGDGHPLLLQRYVEGDHASVSLLVAGCGISCLSLNRQFIDIGMPFTYQGGEVSFPCDRHQQALDLAKRAVEWVPGLKGYVGVDMVIAEDGCRIIEINPRLTTAYVGLRRVANINLAESIWDATMQDALPGDITLSGSATFKKDDLI